MQLNELDARCGELNKSIVNMLSSPPIDINAVLTEKPESYKVQGVYVISTPDDSEIVYIGMTKTKDILGRIRDHKNIDTKSDMKGMLWIFKEYPQDVKEYQVRCIEIGDPRERKFFEYYAIGLMRPKFNK